MEKENNILNELASVAPSLAGLSRDNYYAVPAGYFVSLAEDIMARIRIAEFFIAPNPFETPDSYFETLPQLIMQKIQAQKGRSNEIYNELSEIAPLLNSISKENVLSVPGSYFEHLTVSIPAKPAKIISIGSQIRRGVTYAAAASVLFIVATTSFLYINLHNHTINKSQSIEQKLGGLHDDEIISYLKDNRDILSGDLIPTIEEQDNNIQFILRNTSDEEIQNYLNDYSDTGEKNIKGI